MEKKPAKEAAEENNQTNSAKKPVQTFRLTGRVTDRNTGHGLAGLTVKAIDKDPHYDQQFCSVKRSIRLFLNRLSVNRCFGKLSCHKSFNINT